MNHARTTFHVPARPRYCPPQSRWCLSRLLIWILGLLLSACSSSCGGASQQSIPAPDAALQVHMTPAAACVDGERAMAHIVNILAFGERHAGTPGLEKTRRYIEAALSDLGLSPVRQSFLAKTPHPDLPEVAFANIMTDIGPQDRHILLSGHFDGKIIDDGVFLGANDGGSSTGLLLEFARCLTLHPPSAGVRILFLMEKSHFSNGRIQTACMGPSTMCENTWRKVDKPTSSLW
jgi:hypothetical protein